MRPLFIGFSIVVITIISCAFIGWWWLTFFNQPQVPITPTCGDGACESGEHSCTIDCGRCIQLVKNGEPADKLDVIFLSFGYSATDLYLFADDVANFIDNGLLAAEPFSSNSGKFNFWRVDRIGVERSRGYSQQSESYSMNPDSFIYMTETCPATADVYVVVDFGQTRPIDAGNPEAYIAIDKSGQTGVTVPLAPWQATPRVNINRVSSPDIMVHEFAHALANLEDEYANSRLFYAEDDWVFSRPNVDKVGCPKWCSGELNTSSAILVPKGVAVKTGKPLEQDTLYSCYGAWQRLLSCGRERSDNNKCNAYAQLDPSTGLSIGTEYCNFGVNCRPTTGCYWGAGATNTFRSSPTSIMASSKIEDGFNLISTEEILKRLQRYN